MEECIERDIQRGEKRYKEGYTQGALMNTEVY